MRHAIVVFCQIGHLNGLQVLGPVMESGLLAEKVFPKDTTIHCPFVDTYLPLV